jgi:hypothetical protein
MLLAAQTSINLQQILSKLLPRPGTAFIYDIFLYVIFFLALIIMFMQSDKQLPPTIMMAGVAGMAVIAKLDVFPPKHLAMLVINAGIFVLPFIVAGITKAKKTTAPAVICGFIGGVYFFLFWLISQRS